MTGAVSRRRLVTGLGAGVLGAALLPACTTTRRRRGAPTPTAPTGAALTEPDAPLVIATIGSATGRASTWEQTVSIAISEAVIDVDARWGGLFGRPLTVLERHVAASADEDLAAVVADFAEQGAGVLITSLDEDALVGLLPAAVEAGMAVIDLVTSGMGVRADDVRSAGLLTRLSPSTRALAAGYVDEATSGTGTRTGTPGTVAVLSEDTAQGRSLVDELTSQLNPRAGAVMGPWFHPLGSVGDQSAAIAEIVEAPPALLVVNSGPEVAGFLGALHEALLGPDGRTEVTVPIRLGPAATVDYASQGLPAEALRQTVGGLPGGELGDTHVDMMLNVRPDLQHGLFGYSQQAYDAVALAALAAYRSLSVSGTDIAAALPQVLAGDVPCADYGECRTVMRDALEAGGTTTVELACRSGSLVLGADGDLASGPLRTYTYDDTNALAGSAVQDVAVP